MTLNSHRARGTGQPAAQRLARPWARLPGHHPGHYRHPEPPPARLTRCCSLHGVRGGGQRPEAGMRVSNPRNGPEGLRMHVYALGQAGGDRGDHGGVPGGWGVFRRHMHIGDRG